jgi:phosphoserine phosphatase
LSENKTAVNPNRVFGKKGEPLMILLLRSSASQLVLQIVFLLLGLTACGPLCLAKDPLPSWRDNATKQAIVGFVESVTTPDSATFLSPEQRIAVFDNDGTLWSEQPMYVQLAFALDRVKELAKQRPELKEKKLFQAIVTGDKEYLAKINERDVAELIIETHANTSTDEFEAIVKNWIASNKHPVYQRPYTECLYVPMIELLDYLRAKQFKPFIVSGGGIDFMRPWVESVYGIPPERVIGSSVKMRYELSETGPRIIRLPEIDFVDDKGGKPVGIQRHIGRRPILAVGNSDGDYEMLQYVTAGNGASLGVLIHHTDAKREFAYDRVSHFGKLNRGLDYAAKNRWIVVDMQQDWDKVFPFSR